MNACTSYGSPYCIPTNHQPLSADKGHDTAFEGSNVERDQTSQEQVPPVDKSSSHDTPVSLSKLSAAEIMRNDYVRGKCFWEG